MKKSFEGKIFNISTANGLKSAERYKSFLENKYDQVHTRIVGTDKIVIEGFD